MERAFFPVGESLRARDFALISFRDVRLRGKLFRETTADIEFGISFHERLGSLFMLGCVHFCLVVLIL